MPHTFSEEELHTWFRENATQVLLENEENFILGMGESCFADGVDNKVKLKTKFFNEICEDTAGRAQLLIKSKSKKKSGAYITIDETVLLILRTLISSTTVSLFFEQNPFIAVASIIDVIIDFVENANKCVHKLEGVEVEFCAFLVDSKCINSKIFSDIFRHNIQGFYLEEAINAYCHRVKERDNVTEDGFRKRVEEAAEKLKETNILVQMENNTYYINF